MVDEARLKRILEDVFGIPEGSVDDNTSQDNVPSWDSIHHVNLVVSLEEEFGVTIPDDDAGQITSYKLIRLVLEEQLRARDENS